MNSQDGFNGFRGRVITAYKTDKAVSISKSCGIPVSTLQSILGGSLPRIDNLVTLAKGANVSAGWLATGEGPMKLGESIDSDSISIPRHEAMLSAGNGLIVDTFPITEHMIFSKDHLKRITGKSNADGLFMVYVEGDSMEPTIKNGDLIMVDTTKKIVTNGIYALSHMDMVYVKRLNRQIDHIDVISDNPKYDKMTMRPEDVDKYHINGTVVWVGARPQ